jgi:uncharacterized damage-inducible protein DinB
MMRGPDLRVLLEHMAWADAALWRAALATPRAADDARVRELLHHVAEVQWLYLGFARGDGPATRALASFRDLAELHAWARDYHATAARFVAAQPDPGRSLELPWAEQIAARFGRVMPASLGDALLQVTSHSTYHRGQVNTRIRELGGEPAHVDYIIWVWLGRPDADWTVPDPPLPDA